MVVALARTTQDGRTWFGHNSNQPHGEAPVLVRLPGRNHAPDEGVAASHRTLVQARHTWTVLGGRAGPIWGCQHGLNEKGVAVGCTTIYTRLAGGEPGLTGTDLVRLARERGGTACQAIEVLTDLISRHGLHQDDVAFLVADSQEACLVEAAGHHWVLAEVGSLRTVTSASLLRQDWDRISRGLAGLAIERG
jgi:dipeptidase